MRKLLVFVDWFSPGFKGGGQIQSCVNLATALQHEIDIFVVTTDRDMNSDTPYANIVVNQWVNFSQRVKVKYLSPAQLRYKFIKQIILAEKPDVIYLNSMFSVPFTLVPLEVCRILNWQTRVVLAPRGMLHDGALQYKTLKKKLFFHVFKLRNFHRRIVFQATDKTEAADVIKVFGKKARQQHVADFPASGQSALQLINKEPGKLNCLFLSRICPTKNLLFLLNALFKVRSKVHLSIVGPPEDQAYWEICQKQIASLPHNITTEYFGARAHYELNGFYQANHLMALPSFGENFGHVIFESLLNGRPVLISNRTPWKDLKAQGVGWDLPLEKEEAFVAALEAAGNWSQDEFDETSTRSWEMAAKISDVSELKQNYLELFS
jgi:glycosyltransferase involved in cell wall biosynthesis